MLKKKPNTNRPHAYAKRWRDLVPVSKFRPFGEERWKQLLTAMAYEFARQRKAKGKDISSSRDSSAPPKG